MKPAIARLVNELRRVLPSSLVPFIVVMRTTFARFRPAIWADAQAQMRYVVGGDRPDEVIKPLALAYIRRMIWRGEARWHPELVTRQPIHGLEHLRGLQEAGTAYVIGFAHHGDYEGISSSMAWAGIPNHSVVTELMFAPVVPVWMQQQKQVFQSNGAALINVEVGSEGIKEVLASGGPVCIAVDIPGRSKVTFLGHDVSIASGAARIARDCDVPVVVVTARPNPKNLRGCSVFEVSEPLLPEQFDSVGSLLKVVVRQLEAAMLAWPEATEYPMRRFDPVQMNS